MARAVDTTKPAELGYAELAMGYGRTDLGARTRVELHPATDRWMSGDRYGTIESSLLWRGKPRYRVRMDRSGASVIVVPSNLKPVEG